jgi:hypothetical protein
MAGPIRGPRWILAISIEGTECENVCKHVELPTSSMVTVDVGLNQPEKCLLIKVDPVQIVMERYFVIVPGK